MTPDPAGPAAPRPRLLGRVLGGLPLMLALLVLCLVLAATTLGAWWRSEQRRDDTAATAAADRVRTSELPRAVTLTERVLSYDWRTLDRDVAATEPLLAPGFRKQYAATMAGVRDETVRDQVALEATAVGSSVVSARADRLVALVFVDQATTARGTPTRRLDRTRVLVTLTRDDGEWRVSRMDAF